MYPVYELLKVQTTVLLPNEIYHLQHSLDSPIAELGFLDADAA